MENTQIPTEVLPRYTVEEFRALSLTEQRLAIIKDALAQIQARRYHVETGSYFKLDILDDNNAGGLDLRDLILQSKEPCQVCAMGAIFASAIRLDDRLEVVNVSDENWYQANHYGRQDQGARAGHFNDKLKEFFSPRTTDLMEVAFERTGKIAHNSYRLYDAWNSYEEDRLDVDDAGNWRPESDFADGEYTRGEPGEIAIVQRGLEFGDRYPDNDTERLEAILQNMLANDGEFVP